MVLICVNCHLSLKGNVISATSVQAWTNWIPNGDLAHIALWDLRSSLFSLSTHILLCKTGNICRLPAAQVKQCKL